MKIIIRDAEVQPPSQRSLAKYSNVMEHTLRKRVHELLQMVLDNGGSLKKGVKVYP
jgi:transcription initiation factor TFIIIB Brf1 subunit/transcription initiation factor TFIIB